MKPWWTVQIIETSTGKVVRQISAKSARDAEKIERGVMINLNHDQFHTDIKSSDDEL